MHGELLKDKVAVITGGTAGIGKAIAKAYLAEGAIVCLLASQPERGARAVEELQNEVPGARVEFQAVDISQFATVKSTMDAILAKYGRVDILVNNAGITRDGLLMKMTEEDWDRVLDVNAKSCFNTCQALVRTLLKAKRGKIINVTSIVGLTGNAGQVNYAASKAAIIGFSKALAKELAGRQITVNCIAPGFIKTEMTHGLEEVWKEKIPMGRMGEPADIARVALFLASPLSDYMTGQVLVVDGGLVM